MTDAAAPPAPRDAASLILLRRDGPEPRVLMGQRGAAARFMPSKFVFPGGAVDADDGALAAEPELARDCARRLAIDAPASLARALAFAAIRETFEETGVAIGRPDAAAAESATRAPAGWRAFYGRGLVPACGALSFVFRAVTPPTRPVRFDARFFLADADAATGDLDDFAEAEAELSHLSWLTLPEARRLDLPFITTVVLAEVEARLARGGDPEAEAARPVPYFRHADGRTFIDALP